jgi:hypothetical protein
MAHAISPRARGQLENTLDRCGKRCGPRVSIPKELFFSSASVLMTGAGRSIRIHIVKHSGEQDEILMVLTSHDILGNTGLKTGFWLEEFAAP